MLRKITALALKELTGFFSSLAALLFLGAFLGATLFVFFWGAAFFARNLADVRPLFQWMPVLLIFLIAALTMRAWAEERRAGTIELLLTAPTSLTELILGKFFGVLALVSLAILLTLPLPISVAFMGSLEWGPVIGGYIAAFCLAAAYTAIGLWVSSRTENQIVSLIVTALLAGLFYLIGADTITALVGYRTAEWLHAIGTGARFTSITRGVLDLRDLYYYLSITAVFLVLNRLALEKLRWANNTAQPTHRRWYGLTALLVCNALAANLWLGQLNWARVDLTTGQRYTLSEATRNSLQELQEPLLIRGYFSAATHPLLAPLVPQLRDLLAEYAVAGHRKVQVEFIDPHDDPQLEAEAGSRYGIRPVPFQVASKYQASVINSYFDILIAYGDQFQTLNFRDLIEIKQTSDNDLNVELKNPEYAITNALRKVLTSYQGSGSVFDTLQQSITFTGYLSAAERLPATLQTARAVLTTTLNDLQQEAHDKFKVTVQDPDQDPTLAKRLTHDFGFRPMVVGLLDPHPFWFYMVLSDGKRSEHIPLPAELNQANFKTAITAAIKRFSPGFLKTVAVLSPPSGQGMGPSFNTLRSTLSTSTRWLDADLKNGQVPTEADMLIVLDPQSLDEKQIFAIDQFLMQGGSVLIATSTHTINLQQNLTSTPQQSGLEAWFAQYGLTLSKELVLDQQSGSLPIPIERDVGGFTIREIHLAAYPYIIDVRDTGLQAHHPVTAHLEQLYVPWAAALTVDAEKNKARTITELLHSSARSWTSTVTTLLPDYARYPKYGFAPGEQPTTQTLAVMLSGQFDSTFKGKASPLASTTSTTDSSPAPVVHNVIEHSPDSARLIVVGSNDLFSDQTLSIISQTLGTNYLKPMELAQNIVDWSLEDQALLSIRSRAQFARTLLPLTRSKEQFWEYLNYGLALGGLLLVWFFNRRRRHHMMQRQLKLLTEV